MPEEINLNYWLLLNRLPAFGPRRCLALLKRFDNIAEIFAAKNHRYLERLIPAETLHAITHPDWRTIEQDLIWANNPNCHIVTLDNPLYPNGLREITAPPLVLYLKGQIETLNTPQIAIVGTRNPSWSGRETAFQFAYELAKYHFTITSGLAYGIDSYGHQGALKANGQTIAVLGSGINIIYPKKHLGLAEQIVNQGAIISEFPPETPPLAKHFPQRNRIISGLCHGVLVVEAHLNSGSLITARMANEQGREVFAVPGSIHNSFTKGCHHLIQTGAKLVMTIEDIMQELNPSVRPQNHLATTIKPNESQQKTAAIFSAAQIKVWNCIEFDPASIDLITLRSGLTIDEVSSILLFFEIQGLIVSTPTGYSRTLKQDHKWAV